MTMPNNFSEWLILVLVGLLFGKDYILTPILAKWGFNVNGNGKYQEQINELKEHARIANEEMGEIKQGITGLNTKMDIVLRHLKL